MNDGEHGKPGNGSKLEFAQRPKGGTRWARQPENLAAMKQGRFRDIMPETLESAFALGCPYRCGECPYPKPLRLRLGEFAKPDDVLTTTLPTARRVIDRAVAAGATGHVMTGGGEPTTNPEAPAILEYAAASGMVNCLYSNGTMLGAHPELADALLQPATNLAFVRLSRNFSSSEVAARFARVRPGAVELQSQGWQTLLEARERNRGRFLAAGKEPPALMVSVISDRSNVEDLPAICADTAATYRKVVRQRYPGDDFLVRPLTRHQRESYSTHDHPEEVIQHILSTVGEAGPGRQVLVEAGMHVKLGFGLQLVGSPGFPTYDRVLEAEYGRRDRCWANGFFLTVGPDARAYFCCDRNCTPGWAVGDLREQTVAEIYRSELRNALFERVHAAGCGPAQCEATCRTCRLNQIARDLRSGEMSEAELHDVAVQATTDPWPLL